MIRGKVIRILSETAVVVNVGRLHGVTTGMRFGIVGPEEDKIVDPETGRTLGALRNVKALVVAREVYDKFAIARTEVRTEYEEVGPLAFTLAWRGKPRVVTDTFEAQLSDVCALFGGDRTVRVGDDVEEASADDG